MCITPLFREFHEVIFEGESTHHTWILHKTMQKHGARCWVRNTEKRNLPVCFKNDFLNFLFSDAIRFFECLQIRTNEEDLEWVKYLFITLLIYLSIYLLIHLFIYFSIYLFIFLLIYSFIYFLNYLFTYLFIYSFIYLFSVSKSDNINIFTFLSWDGYLVISPRK
jgi:hypothetical protein